MFSENNKRRKNVNVLTHRQKGGTCWFHGAINGLLMSWKSRRVLEQSIEYVNTNIGGRSIFDEGPTCLSKRAPRQLFWSYIVHRLGSTKGNVNARYVNADVIRNLGLRRKRFPNILSMVPRLSDTKRSYVRRFMMARHSVYGGTLSDMINLYDKLFPGDFSMKGEAKATTFVIEKAKNFPKMMRHNGHQYELSHCYIQIAGALGGHVVAGYLSRVGNYNVFDSGVNEIYRKLPWYDERSDQILMDIVREDYRIPVKKVSKWAVYIRSDRI